MLNFNSFTYSEKKDSLVTVSVPKPFNLAFPEVFCLIAPEGNASSQFKLNKTQNVDPKTFPFS